MGLFHKHVWELISAIDNTDYHYTYDLRKAVGTENTIVLEICIEDTCKKFRRRKVMGHNGKEIIDSYH